MMLWRNRMLLVTTSGGKQPFLYALTSFRQASTDGPRKPPESSLVPETPEPLRSGLQASHKRGTGGRSSFSGNIVTIFGASGVMGQYVVNRIGKEGAQMIIPYRRTGYSIKHLRPSADLGQMLFFHYHLEDEESIRKAVKHSNIVINLIGSYHETRRFSFDGVHVDGARRLARIAREMGVQRFIHISALNCTPDPPENIIPGGSGFLRSKYFGELAVREEFPSAAIIRPAEIYSEDITQYFTYWFHWMRRRISHGICMYEAGQNVYKMPLWMGDFLDGFMRVYRDPTLDGRTYEFAGPYAYNIGELVDWIYRKANRGETLVSYQRKHFDCRHQFLTNLFEFWTWVSKRRPVWSWEMMEAKEATTDALTGVQTLQDLGITNQMVFDIRAPFLIAIYDRLAYMVLERGEFPEPPPPTRYPQVRKLLDEDEPIVRRDMGDVRKPSDTSRLIGSL